MSLALTYHQDFYTKDVTFVGRPFSLQVRSSASRIRLRLKLRYLLPLGFSLCAPKLRQVRDLPWRARLMSERDSVTIMGVTHCIGAAAFVGMGGTGRDDS